VLVFAIVIALLGLSLLGQQPMARWLGVQGPVRPLMPFRPGTPWPRQLAVRGAGLFFTFSLVVLVGALQFGREHALTARVDVAPGLAAAEGGLENGDVVLSVEGVAVESFGAMREAMLGGSAVKHLQVRRGEVVLERTVTLREGLLGVKPSGEARTDTEPALLLALEFPFKLPAVMAQRTSELPMVWALLAVAQAWWVTVFLELAALIVFALRKQR
jgi:membrane-associated protease RseP (regulator of RpoE activity)